MQLWNIAQWATKTSTIYVCTALTYSPHIHRRPVLGVPHQELGAAVPPATTQGLYQGGSGKEEKVGKKYLVAT